ncbi:hypothetical protein FALCPG4_000232 [Fusarium falciforme]
MTRISWASSSAWRKSTSTLAPPMTGRRDSRLSPGQGIPPCPNFRDLKLRILTHDTDTSEFIVYTGYVTKDFLEKFHDPFKAPPDDDDAEVTGIKIEYTRVPIWPILGLRERLGKALGQDVVGAFNPDEIETWEKRSGEAIWRQAQAGSPLRSH